MLTSTTRSVLLILTLAALGVGILALGGCASTSEAYNEFKAELMKAQLGAPAPIWDNFSKNGTN